MKFWKDNRILVTGANGFVGHAVMDELNKYDLKKIINPKKNRM